MIAAVTILALLAGVAIFLVAEGMPALTASASELPEGKSFIDYVAPLAFGTVLAGGLRAPSSPSRWRSPWRSSSPTSRRRRVALTLGFLVDLLAAIPSIIYGLWGIFVLGPAAVPVMKWLEENLGFIPLFEGPASATGRTMFVVGLVLAVMILPIVSAIAREVFSQTPRKQLEGAQALGATRWEMIRMTVLPFGKSSVISGAMLGLGRALGETMAVTIILSVSGIVTFNLISQANPSTIAANIALNFPESSGLRDQPADRDRPRPLRDHPGHQPHRAGDHRPPEQGGIGDVGDLLTARHRQPPGRRRAAELGALRGLRRLAGSLVAAVEAAIGIFTIALSLVFAVRRRRRRHLLRGRASSRARAAPSTGR